MALPGRVLPTKKNLVAGSLASYLTYEKRHLGSGYGAAFFFTSVFIMRIRINWAVAVIGLLLATARPTLAQVPNNDGFQRRNGQMQVVRNGQPRPMTRDAHLPTGVTVTKDGFVVSPDGRRTELREGQGCDLRGRPVAVRTASNGTLALGEAEAPRATVVANERDLPARSVLAEIFGQRNDGDERYFKFKKYKKHQGKGKGHGRWKGEEDD